VGYAADIALTDDWIAVVGNRSPYSWQLRATNILQNYSSLSSLSLIDTGVFIGSLAMGGRGLDKRLGWVKSGQGYAKEQVLNGQNVPLGAAIEVAVNSGRVARRDSSGNIYAIEGENLAIIPGGGGNIIASGSGVRLN
jgi:hypothetical protein